MAYDGAEGIMPLREIIANERMPPMGVKSERMKVFIDDAGQVAVEASFARQGLCNRGSFDGDVTAVGRLRSGQYFYGRGSVKVIDRRMSRVAVMVAYWLACIFHRIFGVFV